VKQLSQQATGSAISPAVSNSYTEVFEQLATNGAKEKTSL
jgi:hypothetical protein